MKSPFKFLDAYTPRDRNYFFGRDREIEELYQKVLKTSLVLVYGRSGTGKTSLVQCGLAKRFRGPDWQPFFIRREDDFNQSLQNALSKAVPEGQSPRATPGENVSLIYEHYLRPVYLIFDQFEEIFTLGKEEEQQQLAQSLQAIINAELPCKIILVMREEYIGRLYYFEEALPTINDFRMRVEPMEDRRIVEVIQESCKKFNIALEDKASTPALIIAKLRGQDASESGMRERLQLPYLQVYLDGLYRHVYATAHPENPELEELPTPLPALTFSGDGIDSFGSIEKVLADFLDHQVAHIQDTVKTAHPTVPNDAVRRVLDLFVTLDGTKRPLKRSEIKAPQLHDDAINLIVNALQEARILRPEGSRYELAHDALAQRIDAQRSKEDRRLQEIVDFVKTRYAQHLRKLTGFLPGHEVALVRSHPDQAKIKEQLSRSEKIYVRDSENRALLRQYGTILGVVALVFLALSGLVIRQTIQIAQLKPKVDSLYASDSVSFLPVQIEVKQLGLFLSNKNIQEALVQVDSIRAKLLREVDSIPPVVTPIPADKPTVDTPSVVVVPPKPEPEKPKPEQPNPLRAQYEDLMRRARIAEGQGSQNVCKYREAFDLYTQAAKLGYPDDGEAERRKTAVGRTVSEEFSSRYNDGIILSRTNAKEALGLLEQASCLRPENQALKEKIQELKSKN